MLKYLAILAAFLAVATAISGQPNRAADQSQESAKRSQPAVLPTGSPNRQASSQTDQPKPNSPSWWTALERPDWWLVIIAGLTGCVIGWQSWETRKAAEATVESAKATRDSIRLQEKGMKLTVNAERPYLVISVESPSPNKFVFIAKNEGKTPARIKSIWSKPIPAVMGQPGPVPSDDETAESLISTPPQVLPTNGTCTVFYCDEHRLELMQASKFSSIYFYGRIVYFNTLETDPDRPYEITDPARNS
jgi:hypothetical protein